MKVSLASKGKWPGGCFCPLTPTSRGPRPPPHSGGGSRTARGTHRILEFLVVFPVVGSSPPFFFCNRKRMMPPSEGAQGGPTPCQGYPFCGSSTEGSWLLPQDSFKELVPHLRWGSLFPPVPLTTSLAFWLRRHSFTGQDQQCQGLLLGALSSPPPSL